MKSKLYRIIPVALAVAVGLPYFAGCSSTATRESTGEYVDDTVITTKVKTALARDKIVNAFAVGVETFKGVVQLSGFVDTAEQKNQAELVASQVSDVRSVKNSLVVKSTAASSTP